MSTNLDVFKAHLVNDTIPYVSDHHIRKFTLHSIRIHIEFPTNRKGVIQSVALLASDLPDVSRLLRAISLTYPHPSCLHETIEYFPRIKMRIQFSDTITTTEKDQSRLLHLLKGANSIGVVKILNLNYPSLRSILPGYDGFHYKPDPRITNDNVQEFMKNQWFVTLRKVDRDDYLSIMDWKLDIAARAVAAKNYRLAQHRYLDIMAFCAHSTSCENEFFFCPLFDFEPQLRQRIFRAGVGLVENEIRLGKWKDAARYIKGVLADEKVLEHVPEAEIQHALDLQLQIKEHSLRKKV